MKEITAISELLNQMVAHGVPGVYVYIEDADGSSRFYTAGYANLETKGRMAPNMIYHSCSTTKTFTATVILQLVAEGLLDLGHTLEHWLPEFSFPNVSSITLEHLLRMRSGLFDFESDEALAAGDRAQRIRNHIRPWTTHEVVSLAAQHKAAFMPGEKYQYCNTNFCILELIAEKATGLPMAELFRRRIFQPLHLRDTLYPDAFDLSLPQPHIRGYDFTDKLLDVTEVFMGRGDGAMLSTAMDLARFFRALLTGKLLSQEMLEQMLTTQPQEPDEDESYGLGIFNDKHFSLDTLWGHSGGGYGQAHNALFELESGRFVDVMTNGITKSVSDEEDDRVVKLIEKVITAAFAENKG